MKNKPRSRFVVFTIALQKIERQYYLRLSLSLPSGVTPEDGVSRLFQEHQHFL